MRVAAFELSGPREAPWDVRTGTPFDTAAYSLLKHGDTRAAARLGDAVADVVLAADPGLLTDPVAPVLPVAYLAVPPACLLLARRVAAALDAERVPHGLAPARVVRVAKDTVTRTDYATSSAADRAAELASIGFRLTQDVRGARLVLVDDVRVTGAAEDTLRGVLAGSGAASVLAAYVAVVDARLASDPSVEAALNHARVRSVADMVPSVRAGTFAPTIRFLKRLLAAPADERAAFLAACPPGLRAALLDGARATGETFCAAYAEGVADLARRSVRAAS